MKIYNKLVRDRIPEIIAKSGSTAKTRILDDQEYQSALLEKLVEEALEVKGAEGNQKELMKEIGDVLEVIDAILLSFELSRQEINTVKAERKKSRGGFDGKIFLESTA